jgi:hypothetical protein
LLHGRISLYVALVASVLTACGGSSTPAPAPVPPPPPSPSVLQGPTVVNLYPDGASSDGTRLFVFVTAVGSLALNVPSPLAFDTGSSGMTLYAPTAFPGMATACSVDAPTGCGFTFPAGQHSITFNNVTVTDVQATRCYGGVLGHAQTGNIGFASVTFGDAAGTLTTGVMPILFYYKITTNPSTSASPTQCDDSGSIVDVPPQKGWFGVNTAVDGIVIGGILAKASSPPCTNGVDTTCLVASVLYYLQYANGIDAGFMLTHQSLQMMCSINSGNCSPTPMLTVGLTPTQTAGFNPMALDCSGTPTFEGFPNCLANIANSGITVSAADGPILTTYADAMTLFDSGTPDMILLPPSGSVLPMTANTHDIVPGEKVLINLPNGYEFSYSTALTGIDETVVNVTGIGKNIVGIDFFQNHDFYIDFTTSMEGWH